MGTSVDSKIQRLLDSKTGAKKEGTQRGDSDASDGEAMDVDEEAEGSENGGFVDGDEEDAEDDAGEADDDDEDDAEDDEDEEKEPIEDVYNRHRIESDDEKDAPANVRDIERKETKKTKRDKEKQEKALKAWEALQSSTTFESLSLSRPILKALAEQGFQHPTSIQSQTIPLALAGRGT